MTVAQFVQQWTEQAAHDLEAARGLRQLGFYDTCIVQCQQSAEKYLKALWANQQSATPPRTHDLELLTRAIGAPASIIAAMADLTDQYVMARYPDVGQTTPYRRYVEGDADRYLRSAEEVQQWVQTQLPSSTP